jgi:alpha-L-rhamnosidase
VDTEAGEPVVARLTVEHRDPLGIGTPAPRLSWSTVVGTAGWRQAAAELEIDGERSTIEGPASVLVAWPAAPLRSRERRTVRVRVHGTDGSRSGWSDPVVLEAGLLEVTDWRAVFVAPEVPDEGGALLRTAFDLTAPVVQARLHATSLGVHQLELNGRPVGDRVLEPGWTSYAHRLNYGTHDVTDLLVPGTNSLVATLAEGWYRGRLGWDGGRRAIYGDQLALLAQLEITTADGERQVVATDASWRWAHGPLTFASIYDGEHHDARIEPTGWRPVTLVERDLSTLTARSGPPVRRTEERSPIATWTAPSGRTIFDFGQNLVGRLRITVDGPAGAEVVLRHAEILEDGELCTEPLRLAAATDRYVLSGEGTTAWEPDFTYHGFRYADVEGPVPESVRAVVLHSDVRRTGWFECSDERVNRLHENVVWSMRGNFLDIPTDCPQRDERLGWTGDLTVFAPAACFLHDVAGFLSSWLADLALEQDPDRGVPFVVPNVSADDLWIGTAVWSDAAVVVPWTLYERYGDVGILRAQYPSMRSWVDLVIRAAGPDRHWEWPFQFGDWLDPAAPPEDPAAGRTDRHLVANAWFCHSVDLLARTSELLGEVDDAAAYRTVRDEAVASFARHFVRADGRLTSDSQTAYALAIRFGLVAGTERDAAGRRLAQLVREAGDRIGTGFAGTPLLCDALCDAGEVDTAYRLLLQTEAPSWLHPVVLGATTIWERWDGLRPDGTRNPGEMNSFNHYALGAVADWLHRRVAGLAPAEPGYHRLEIAPLPGPGLDWARARHDTPYGVAEAGWERDGGQIRVFAVVPPNTSATIIPPDGSVPFDVGAGSHEWTF